ncbi:MAG: dihydroorotate dehydrogenase, partial [Lysobacteraceae bacterium]
MNRLNVRIGQLLLQNPVMPASGTFAEGVARVIDVSALGALVTKTITAEPRRGNPVPRVAEVRGGMLNAIGIPSKGVAHFASDTLAALKDFGPPVICSISAHSARDFARLAAEVAALPGVAGIEANISCPNIEEDGKSFAMDPRSTERVMRELRAATTLPLWAKLTPNVSDIAAVALAAELAGADAMVVSNTVLGMAIDIETRRPRLGNVMGGLSGPAIKPMVLRMVYQCHRALRIPVIGCGGIETAADAIEYLLAGAAAVQVGTATFNSPGAMPAVIAGIDAYLQRHGIAQVSELT